MTRQTNPLIQAACAALALPEGESVPEWVQLLPAVNGEIKTHDGRGPYVVRDPAAIIAASFADERDADGLLIDENHALDIAAKEGRPSPSRGRIKQLEARADGIWGRVKWTVTGRALMRDQAYRGISPVILFNEATGEVHAILRAGLTNYPNLRGLTALNAEEPRKMMKIAKALGLAEDASEDAIIAKITAMMDKKPDAAMQAAMDRFATLVKAPQGDLTAITAAVELAVGGKDSVTELQSQVATQAAELKSIRDAAKREDAEDYIDGEIAGLRMGLNASNRDSFIKLYMIDPEAVKSQINGMSKGTATHASQTPPVATGVLDPNLSPERQGLQLHQKALALQAQRKAAGQDITFEQAVTAAAEGQK